MFYKEVGKSTQVTKLLDCALIGACAVIRSNTVFAIRLFSTGAVLKEKNNSVLLLPPGPFLQECPPFNIKRLQSTQATKLLDCALIGACAVIRSNTVFAIPLFSTGAVLKEKK